MPLTLLLHGKHGAGVTYEPLGPWLVPWKFPGRSLDEDYAALREGVGLIDYTTQAAIECRGEDRVDFLQRLLTNDVKALAPGQGSRGALLGPAAKLVADGLVLADQDAHWMLFDLSQAEAAVLALEKYHFSERVTLTFHERRLAVLAFEGPRSLPLVASLGLSSARLARTGDHVIGLLGDIPARAVRRSLTGGTGLWCMVDSSRLEECWAMLLDRGQPVGLRSTGWEALNAARIEAGEPWFGIDMEESTLLPETGLERIAASDSKGCYIGQEIVARMETYGSASKRLMGLLIDGDDVPKTGDQVLRDGQDAGWVTSAAYSPALKRAIAMGYVKRGAYEPGTKVGVLRETALITATVKLLGCLEK